MIEVGGSAGPLLPEHPRLRRSPEVQGWLPASAPRPHQMGGREGRLFLFCGRGNLSSISRFWNFPCGDNTGPVLSPRLGRATRGWLHADSPATFPPSHVGGCNEIGVPWEGLSAGWKTARATAAVMTSAPLSTNPAPPPSPVDTH